MTTMNDNKNLFEQLSQITYRPEPFEYYTADDLWTDEHTSAQMLKYHLDENVDMSSRNHAFIDRSVDWIVSHFDITPDSRILDLGCGPGLYTTRLARRSAKVTGIDFSIRSLGYAHAIAEQEGLNINYINQNYLDLNADGEFDLIIMIMCDFCALSPEQRRVMLSKFRQLLSDGGSVLLDAYSLAAFKQREEGSSVEENQLNGFWSSDRYFGFLNSFKYLDAKVTLDKYTIVEEERIRTVYNWLQHFDLEALTAELAQEGLGIENVFSDVSGTLYDPQSTEFAIVAKRAESCDFAFNRKDTAPDTAHLNK